MVSDRRSHPTVRPHALALGVLERPGTAARLSFLGAPYAGDLAAAMMLDTLASLSTFPVRHRVAFDASGRAPTTAAAKLPATWKRQDIASTDPNPARTAFAHLLALGCDACLMVATDGPVLPLGDLFDDLLALAQPPSQETLLVGKTESGAVFAYGLAKDHGSIIDVLPWSADPPGSSVEDAASQRSVKVRCLTTGYLVDSLESARKLLKDVEGGAFAPNCRKLLERPELKRALT